MAGPELLRGVTEPKEGSAKESWFARSQEEHGFVLKDGGATAEN